MNGKAFKFEEKILIARAQAGDPYAMDTLLAAYKGLTYYICDRYYFRDGDRKDLRQEALIGLVEAIKAYDSEKSTKSFKNFAVLCIQRELVSCLKKSNRKKQKVLNEAVPIYAYSDYEDEKAVTSNGNWTDIALRDDTPSPEEYIIEKEATRELLERMNVFLSDLEKEILLLRLEGHSYQEITHSLNLHSKSVDNAIQRIRKKFYEKKIFIFNNGPSHLLAK